MKDFDPQEVKMGPAKHAPLDAFEAIDVSFDDPIAPRQREGSTNGSVIPTGLFKSPNEVKRKVEACSTHHNPRRSQGTTTMDASIL
jgi:hypothetical protein